MEVVIGTRERRPVFAEHRAADTVFPLVRNHPRTLAACLMPDHLHWLLGDPEDLSGVVGKFKSFASHALWNAGSAARGSRIWQRSFWDRFVRNAQDLEVLIDYILANPVRAGLVTERQSYPWSVALWEKVEQI